MLSLSFEGRQYQCLTNIRNDVRQQSFSTGATAVQCNASPTYGFLVSLTDDSGQHVRRYANGAPPSSSSNTLLYGAVGAAALGSGYWYLNSSSTPKPDALSAKVGAPESSKEESNIPNKAGGNVEPVKCFKGGDQGFVSLVLDKVEQVSSNTKFFRFKLDGDDAVSGLPVASALLTKYKGPEMEKPVIRPYTPISDEGMLHDSLSMSRC
jgi:hypothetical protein